MTNIQQLMKAGQQIQAKVQELHDSLDSEEIEATSGGGMVTARVSGKGNLVAIAIDPLAVDPRDVEMLEDLVLAAVGEAQTRARKFSEERIRSAAGGLPMKLPGLF